MNPTLGLAFNFLGLFAGVVAFVLVARERQTRIPEWPTLMAAGIVGGAIAATVVQRLLQGQVTGTGGRTILAGVGGGWLAVELVKLRIGVRVSSGAMWAVALPIGEGFGRIGCWFNGCCYGRSTPLAWAVWQHDAWRHPTQFLQAGAAFAIFGVTWSRRQDPHVFALYLLLWSSMRVVVEFLREPTTAPFLAQGAALVGVVIAIIQWRGATPSPTEIRSG